MCGRFVDPNLRKTEVDMSQTKLTPFPRRFNVKPTQDVVILAKTLLEPMLACWWLVPSWHRGSLKDWKATTFNARIEGAKDKPAFRSVWRHGRCLIPAAGYYEWTGERREAAAFYPPGGQRRNAGLRWSGIPLGGPADLHHPDAGRQ